MNNKIDASLGAEELFKALENERIGRVHGDQSLLQHIAALENRITVLEGQVIALAK